MKPIILLLIIPFFAFSQVTLGQGAKLDSLLAKSGKIRSDGIRGFIFQHRANPVLIPPDKLFRNIEQPVPAPVPTGQYVPYSVYVNDVRAYDQKIGDLEVQLAKATTVLENLTENSGTMKDSLEISTKFMEALTALLVAIGTILGFMKFRKKEK